LDFAEKNGYIRGVVREIIHDSGRWVLFYLCAFEGSLPGKMAWIEGKMKI